MDDEARKDYYSKFTDDLKRVVDISISDGYLDCYDYVPACMYYLKMVLEEDLPADFSIDNHEAYDILSDVFGVQAWEVEEEMHK